MVFPGHNYLRFGHINNALSFRPFKYTDKFSQMQKVTQTILESLIIYNDIFVFNYGAFAYNMDL